MTSIVFYVLYFCHLSRKGRSYLAQLRLGILPIKLETGRCENEKVEERLCELCDARVVEDEEHFLFKCTFNDSIRLSGELNPCENVQSDIWKHVQEAPQTMQQLYRKGIRKKACYFVCKY